MPAEPKSNQSLTARLIKRFSSDNLYYLPEEMFVAVKASKAHALSKGRDFSCYVVSDGERHFNNLTGFLKKLWEKKSQFPDNTRIQYVFRYGVRDYTEALHWTVADIQINQGNLKFYIVDSADYLDGLLLQLILICQLCPESQVFSTHLMIQKDGQNCGTFALRLAISLSKIQNLYELLDVMYEPIAYKQQTLPSFVSHGKWILNKINTKDFEGYDELEDFYDFLDEKQIAVMEKALLQLKHIPRDILLSQPEFGSFFKNNQDRELNLSEVKCRNNEKTVAQHIEENWGEYVACNGQTKLGNIAIFKKVKNINDRSLAHLKSHIVQKGVTQLAPVKFSKKNPLVNDDTNDTNQSHSDKKQKTR